MLYFGAVAAILKLSTVLREADRDATSKIQTDTETDAHHSSPNMNTQYLLVELGHLNLLWSGCQIIQLKLMSSSKG